MSASIQTSFIYLILFFTIVIFSSCIAKNTDKSDKKEDLLSKNVSVEHIAGNQDVAEHGARKVEGNGADVFAAMKRDVQTVRQLWKDT